LAVWFVLWIASKRDISTFDGYIKKQFNSMQGRFNVLAHESEIAQCDSKVSFLLKLTDNGIVGRLTELYSTTGR
jgi:hypothetical protein